MKIEFFAPGEPKPGGSKRGFVNRKTGGVIITEDCKRSKEWRSTVKDFARQGMAENNITKLLYCAVRLDVIFYVARPKGHYGTGRNADTIKASSPKYPTVKPDLTKLLRSTEDALTKVLWLDDTQVVEGHIKKAYADGYSTPGALITIQTLEE
jgi:crossover junction endodeoxyribonuclease RusA